MLVTQHILVIPIQLGIKINQQLLLYKRLATIGDIPLRMRSTLLILVQVFKRFTAESFYKILNWLGAEIIHNHADYRLVSSKVLNSFENFKEVNIFLRGMFPLVGYKSTCVFYERNERIAGESHYPLKKMLALAFDGITSLSIKPIRLITGLGFLISIFSFMLILYTLISYFDGNTVPGWSSTLIATCMLGGIQLISLGVIGEYVGKIYLETKGRPRYIIGESTLDHE